MFKKGLDHATAVSAGIEKQEADIASIAHPDSTIAFRNKCHVSLKYRYFYCETPKVACSTIKLTLYRAELEDKSFDLEENRQIHIHELSPLLDLMRIPNFSSRLQSLFKFCFVRDPASRLLSAYLDKIVRCKPQKIPILRALNRQNQMDFPVSFPSFVDVVCEQEPRELDPHWSIQYLHTCADRISYDMIGKFESFAMDFQRILERLEIHERYLHPAQSHRTNATELAAEFLTPEIRRKIEDKYRLDYENFGY